MKISRTNTVEIRVYDINLTFEQEQKISNYLHTLPGVIETEVYDGITVTIPLEYSIITEAKLKRIIKEVTE